MKGSMFCVGSGSFLAYSILDAANSATTTSGSNAVDITQDKKVSSDLLSQLPLDLAVQTALRAVRHATVRDGYSGGMLQVVQVNSTGVHLLKRIDCRDVTV